MAAAVTSLILAPLASQGSGAVVGALPHAATEANPRLPLRVSGVGAPLVPASALADRVAGIAGEDSVRPCPNARRAVRFYSARAAYWLDKLGADVAAVVRVRPRAGCPRYLAHALQRKAYALRGRWEAFLATPHLAGETPWHTSNANPVNRNLYALAVCETGGINGGRPLWTHSNSTYVGALGFAWSTWSSRRWRVRPLPPADAAKASPAEQMAVGRALVREFGNYSSWPSCHRRLGLP